MNWYGGACVAVVNASAKRSIKLPAFSQGPRLQMLINLSKKNEFNTDRFFANCSSKEKTDDCLEKLDIKDTSEINFLKGFIGASNAMLFSTDAELKCEDLKQFCDRFTSNFECKK